MNREALVEDDYIRVRECRHGRFLYNVNDAYVGQSLERYGEFSEEELALLREFTDGVVIDVGANIGALTIPLARSALRVIAFEPQKWVGDALITNATLNKLSNIEVVRACLSSYAHTVRIPEIDPRTPANFGGVGIDTLPPGTDLSRVSALEVQALAFDDIASRLLGDAHISLIKIDVEGHECEVLKGMKNTIQKHRPVLYVENDRKEKSEELVALLRSYGYSLYDHRPYLYSSANYFKEAENIFPNIVSFNLMCLPDERSLTFLLNKLNKYELRKV